MKRPDIPLTRDLVLIGGGHTHALVLLRWGMRPLPGVRVTLINPGPTAPYSGMLPGFVAGHYARDDLDIDLVRLGRFAGARLILGAATALDPETRTITVPGRPPIAYDVASVDIGITSDMPDLPGFANHAVPAKPLGPFADRWSAFLAGEGRARVAVIGGGVAGAELAMAMAHALGTAGREREVRLIDRGEVLRELTEPAQDRLYDGLARCGVQIVENAPIARIEAKGVRLAGDRLLPADFVTGAAGARPYDWLAETGLATHDGFLSVGATLQTSDPRVFATGDCADLTDDPRPKAGVYAVRQAPILFDNLRATLSGGDLRPYRPQSDYLKLVSMGGKTAMGAKFGTARSGPLLWRLKDRIDQAFMAKFRDLPGMEPDPLPLTVAEGVREALGDKPLCGGCGAKVGRDALRSALADLPRNRDDVESHPGDDAAILRTGGQRQVLTTDHLRAVTEDPALMTRIAAVHALGDIWAMGAAPQAATATLILPRMSAEMQTRTMAEIMAVAAEVFGAAGADVVGGHSSMGSEMTIGFTITGLVSGAPIMLSGAAPGDVLILTKPVGTGVILAAEMAGKAKGEWVAAALSSMAQGQGEAAAILSGATAMTDVTGFGLAGHLLGLCEASEVAAEIDLTAVPLLHGALELTVAGTRSSLWPDNAALLPELPPGPRAALLADPQTSGGLLAAISEKTADRTLTRLREAGYDAAIIGRIVEGRPGVAVV